jgi:hypothetical protein
VSQKLGYGIVIWLVCRQGYHQCLISVQLFCCLGIPSRWSIGTYPVTSKRWPIPSSYYSSLSKLRVSSITPCGQACRCLLSPKFPTRELAASTILSERSASADSGVGHIERAQCERPTGPTVPFNYHSIDYMCHFLSGVRCPDL